MNGFEKHLFDDRPATGQFLNLSGSLGLFTPDCASLRRLGRFDGDAARNRTGRRELQFDSAYIRAPHRYRAAGRACSFAVVFARRDQFIFSVRRAVQHEPSRVVGPGRSLEAPALDPFQRDSNRVLWRRFDFPGHHAADGAATVAAMADVNAGDLLAGAQIDLGRRVASGRRIIGRSVVPDLPVIGVAAGADDIDAGTQSEDAISPAIISYPDSEVERFNARDGRAPFRIA